MPWGEGGGQATVHIFQHTAIWKVTGQEDINLEIRKRKFRWIGHTLRKEDGEVPKTALLWNPQGNRKTEKQLKKISNQGSG